MPRFKLPRLRAHAADLLLAAFALFLLLFRADALPPVETTDARYLQMSREMLHSPDPFTPTLNGVRHLHKPPFVYWLGALGMRAAGDGAFGGRLALALAAALTLLSLHRFARAAAGRFEARLAALCLATCPLFFFGARGMSSDPFLLLFLTVSLCGYHLHLSRGFRRDLVAFWGGLALAFLAKGPVALLTVLAVVLADRLLPGARLPWRPVRPLAGGALFLLVALPPFYMMTRAVPGLLDYLVLEQLFGRIGGQGLGHPRPFHYFLWLAPLAFLPWTFFLPAAFRGALRSPLPRFALLWALVPVALFSLPATKLPLYILPSAPGVALLLGLHLAAAMRGGRPAPRVPALATGLFALALAALVFASAFRAGATVELRRACLVIASLLLVAALDALHALSTRRALPAALSAALLVALLATGLLLSIEPLEGIAFRSGRPFAEEIKRRAGGEPFTLFQYRMYFASMDFHLRAPTVHVEFDRDMRFESGGTGETLVSREGFAARLAARRGRAFLLSRSDRAQDFAALTPEVALARDGYTLLEFP